MKELSVEEKAKHYDESLERYKARQDYECQKVHEFIEYLFPELKESDDERIRKALVKYFTSSISNPDYKICGVPFKEVVDWLEKQYEQKPAQEIVSFEAEHGKYYYCIKDYFCGGRKQASKGDVVQALRGLPIMGLKDASEYFLPVNFIKCNSAWSEDDDEMLQQVIADIEDLIATETGIKFLANYHRHHDWLHSLKDRVQPQPKQEWSEEDENHVKSILSTIEYCKAQFPNAQAVVEAYNADIEWLNSLRPQNRWKPSDAQIMALRWVLNHMFYDSHQKEEISGLLEQLKKLREE